MWVVLWVALLAAHSEAVYSPQAEALWVVLWVALLAAHSEAV